jgi:expansin (peptidoglycan-binding protein)
MKLINKIAIVILAGFTLMAANGCKKVIEEQNRSQILPDYFKTDGGVEAAMAGAYSHIRNLYNTEGTAYLTMTGTDDAVKGFGTSTNLITYTQQTDDGNVAGFWNVC